MIKSLVHNGVLFPKEYEPKYFDKKLSPLAEEMLYNYALKYNSEYVKDTIFNNNFYSCLKLELPKEYLTKKFPDDYKQLILKIVNYTNSHKLTDEQKLANKEIREKNKKKYGFAKVNGIKEPLGNYNVEPPGIFIGRGNNSYMGLWKYRIYPKDVIINFIPEKETDKVPKPNIKGEWKDIIHNNNITYIARYIENIGNILDNPKEVRFGSTSTIIQKSDLEKFEKGNELLNNWEKVQKHIIKNIQTSECALIAWLIQFTSIRIGSEETENGVVGASTLKVKNINIKDDILQLNFSGKDSIEYNNTFKVPKYIINAFNKIIKDKKEDDNLFSVSSKQVNEFLNECLPGLTAKVFRTAWAKKLMLDNPIEIKKSWPVDYKAMKLKIQILDVSLRLNHKKTTKVVLNDVLKKLNDRLECEIEKLKTARDKVKQEWKIKTLRLKIEFVEKSYGINLNTALTNYIDPRIIKDICKNKGIPLNKIYPETLLERFKKI